MNFQPATSNDDSHDRIDPLVKLLYDASEEITSEEINDPSTFDELCPLYTSISNITDRYQNPQLIGRGGMKEVFRVYDAKTVRHVALAKPLAKFSHDHFDAFLREAHITARLEHPCIINLFDMDIDSDGRPFFTLEFKQGRSLRAILEELRHGRERDRFTLRKRLMLFLRVCEAIAYAHSQRVLHLDIKPENIQIGEFGEAQVCDWGLGVVMPSDHSQHDSEVLLDPDLYGPLLDTVKGTPTYMSPEQADRVARKTPQMDIYALGCVLCEMVTLQSIQKYRKSRPQIDSALVAMIDKATAHDPADRYADVDSLQEDISRFLAGFSASVQRSSILREAALFYRRHRDVCAVTLGSLVILLLCLSFFVTQLRRKHQSAVAARADAETAWIRADTERALATVAQKTAEQAKERAEESLAAYIVEKNKSEDRLQAQVESAIAVSDHLTSIPLIAHDTFATTVKLSMKHLDTVLSNTPPPESKVWHKKFWLYFLMQDFASATQLLDEEKGVEPDLAEFAREYKDKVNDQGFLDTDDFIAMLRGLCRSSRYRAPLAEKMMIYDLEYPRSIQDRVRIVRFWVMINNHKPDDLELRYDATTRTVRLRGNVWSLSRTLSSTWPPGVRVSLLYTLNPKNLDLRGTEISDLTELDDLDLLQLDIRDTKVTDLSPLAESRSLRRVIVAAGQFPESQIALLRDSLDVEIVEQD
ncbi:serine/threonine-protein kinase pknB [Rhodopirellula maiorica SM1]|uniref:Serine/threonine-protein kinase pknB n=1 Tax=Rhodopirellula maiorica SM1 TaxID=1265738 RepID=M5RVS8_9BACT|nr:protein kinase [Rhodopirellula maiorica]EMI18064.1 serine/threonine-protein kinase pknB [Rhodopirellula maiorica SM1]